jgi:type IV pilus assembly protein PilF
MLRRSLSIATASLLAAGCVTTTSGPENKPWEPEKRAEVHAQLAAGYMQRNQLKVAQEELEKALAIDPNSSAANQMMAHLQARLGNPDKADHYFRRAIATDKNNAQAAHDYGDFLCRQRKYDEALANFDKAIRNPLYRGQEISLAYAGGCLLQKPDLPRAEEYLRASLARNPKQPKALYYLAELQYRNGKYLSARGYIERVFAVTVEEPVSLLLAMRIENALQDQTAAAAYAKRLREKFPNSDETKQLPMPSKTPQQQ